jgi:hypothetical protein
MKRVRFYFILSFLFSCSLVGAQDTTGLLTRAVIMNSDTVPVVMMQEVEIYGTVQVESKMEALNFSRLVYNVKKAYPYAKAVVEKVRVYNDIVASAESGRERRRKMKEAEKDLKDEFKDDIEHMSEEQGIVLLKLIARETGSSSFDIIKEFRGGVEAFFYQSFGKLWGVNLKATYDPNGEDKDIEEIVKLIETGQL